MPDPLLGDRSAGPSWSIIEGDARARLADLADESVQCCVTSPPYYGLRDYGVAGQLGLEPTPDEYVVALVDVFREARRALRSDGTLWLNLGDSYNNRIVSRPSSHQGGLGFDSEHLSTAWRDHQHTRLSIVDGDLKEKDLFGIPWMVAFALRADGWFLRSEIIWAKTACMPESVKDRPSKAHETIFLLTKSPRYFYDHEAIREPDADWDHPRQVLDGQASLEPSNGLMAPHSGLRTAEGRAGLGRNKRTVWTVGPAPFPGAHFATFPPKLIEPCVLAGSRVGDTVLDPFSGSGTTGLVALRHERSYVGIEINPEYAALSRRRIVDDAPLLNAPAEVVENAA